MVMRSPRASPHVACLGVCSVSLFWGGVVFAVVVTGGGWARARILSTPPLPLVEIYNPLRKNQRAQASLTSTSKRSEDADLFVWVVVSVALGLP